MQSEPVVPSLPMGMPERTGNPAPLPEAGRPSDDRGLAQDAYRVAGRLTAVMRRLGGKGRELSAARQHWADVSRETVRRHPIASVAFALAAGVLISRISGSHHPHS